jgi:hypothetical protein
MKESGFLDDVLDKGILKVDGNEKFWKIVSVTLMVLVGIMVILVVRGTS